jgi:hypothetical protein
MRKRCLRLASGLGSAEPLMVNGSGQTRIAIKAAGALLATRRNVDLARLHIRKQQP